MLASQGQYTLCFVNMFVYLCGKKTLFSQSDGELL